MSFNARHALRRVTRQSINLVDSNLLPGATRAANVRMLTLSSCNRPSHMHLNLLDRRIKQVVACLLAVLTISAWARADRLDDYVAGEMRKQQIPGAVVVVVKDGVVATQRAYGTANIEFNVPMEVDDIFSISSITKLFTTAAVFLLVQDGKLRLDDDITAVVPGLPASWEGITVLHCLSHTSGLPDLYEGIRNLPIAFAPDDAIRKVAAESVLSKPGEKSRYNQTEFLLLRLAIEAVSGKSYEAFMAERIFGPLHAASAQFADSKDIIRNKATVYSRYIPDESRFDFVERNGDGVLSPDHMWIVPLLYPESVRAGAGLVMSAPDLAKFDIALSRGTLLHRDAMQLMWNPITLSNGRVADYAAGWRRWVHNGHVIVGHAGGSGVEYDRMLDGHYSVILLTDCPGTDTHSFALGILQLYVPEL